ncbi:hypothetical protein Poli38472_008187 [Pythium oligandrum]|uniref:PDZ domain-containing protein n=1 Tax=Pythium oligandrum TaxID=41045 RepID=A0A8K1CLN7_PYTOL|nr:hypothetical protein Poli38472_008187 [Pythium oligandrum]|eukprot:TMW65545.1 hypothetical protein Poli38472_008187 [Pythium oligandrum]
MAQTLVESIGKTLRLPHPHLQEANRAFTLIETWSQLVALVATQPIAVKPLGYYRTPDDVDIYAFECAMGTGDTTEKKTWKIYRRYSQFQRYVSHSSELLSMSMMVVPRLSQAYMKIFSAKSCKDRLVELHAWLTGVIENTQTYCQQKSSIFTTIPPERMNPAILDKTDALPALILASFLLAGANHPFPHLFKGMPSFAFAKEETNILLTKAPVYPSKLRSSLETNAGLGLRLTASHEQHGKYYGAMVSGFLRDVSEMDKQLAQVNVGSKLVCINGVDVADEPFEKVLSFLRSASLPLRLRFVYNPHLQRRTRGRSVYLRGESSAAGALASPSGVRGRRSSTMSTYRDSMDRLSFDVTPTSNSSSTNTRNSRTSTTGVGNGLTRAASASASGAELGGNVKRSQSVDARKSMGIFGSVFSDLFGRRRVETADMVFDNQTEEIFSWDDMGGEHQDLISRGFFTYLPQSMLHEMRSRHKSFQTNYEEPDEKAWKDLDKRKGQGIWSTAAGPVGLAFGACKLRDIEAAMLEIPPVFFSSLLSHMGSEKQLMKGFVLVSVNNESTFGVPFADVMKMLMKASRPTSLCFRWFKDYSPFLETELAEQDLSPEMRRSLRHDPAKTFENSMDCLSEAQADLCSNLHLALVENASIRNEIGALQDTNREIHVQYEQAIKAQGSLQSDMMEQRERISKLLQDVADLQLELNQAKQQVKAAEHKVANAKNEQQILLERAHANAVQKIAENEEWLIKESNKSIENAKNLAERNMQKRLEVALDEMQRKHEEYLQKLAEEHSEEVESLSQQVAVWRHQVEVLTEAEKRNYAASANNGPNAYHDYHRSRFGFGDSPSSNSSSRTFRTSEKPYGTMPSQVGGGQRVGGSGYPVHMSNRGPGGAHPKEAAPSPRWNDQSPQGFNQHSSSEFSDRSSATSNNQSTNGTIWERVVSLIAD